MSTPSHLVECSGAGIGANVSAARPAVNPAPNTPNIRGGAPVRAALVVTVPAPLWAGMKAAQALQVRGVVAAPPHWGTIAA